MSKSKGQQLKFEDRVKLQAYLEDEILLKGYRKDNQKFIIGYKGEHICFIAKCEMK